MSLALIRYWRTYLCWVIKVNVPLGVIGVGVEAAAALAVGKGPAVRVWAADGAHPGDGLEEAQGGAHQLHPGPGDGAGTGKQKQQLSEYKGGSHCNGPKMAKKHRDG